LTERSPSGMLRTAVTVLAGATLWAPCAYSALDLPLIGRTADDLPADLEDRTTAPLEQRTLGPAQHQRPAAEHVSRARAAELARQKYGGRILDVRWTGTDYRVKLLQSGNVRIVTIADDPNNKAQ